MPPYNDNNLPPNFQPLPQSSFAPGALQRNPELRKLAQPQQNLAKPQKNLQGMKKMMAGRMQPTPQPQIAQQMQQPIQRI